MMASDAEFDKDVELVSLFLLENPERRRFFYTQFVVRCFIDGTKLAQVFVFATTTN